MRRRIRIAAPDLSGRNRRKGRMGLMNVSERKKRKGWIGSDENFPERKSAEKINPNG